MTKRLTWFWAVSAVAIVGCGGSASEGEAEAESEAESESEAEAECEPEGDCDPMVPTCQFSLPEQNVQANTGSDDDPDPPLAPADYACLGKNPPPPAPAGDVTVSGIVEDYQSEGPLEGATVEVFASSENFDDPIATATSGGGAVCDEPAPGCRGWYTITFSGDDLEAGRVSWRVTAEDQLTTLHLNQEIECETADPCAMDEDRISVSEVTAVSIPAILGTMMPPGTSVIVGDIIDCQRRSVTGANGRLYDRDGGLIRCIEVYYFEGSIPLRRSARQWTSPNGVVGMLKVLPGDVVDIRAYGNIEGVETLLSSVRVPPLPDSVVITDMDPLAEPAE